MRILLVHPPMDFYPEEVFSIVPPLGLAYIAAFLEKDGHEVKILDCWALSWRKPLKVKIGEKTVNRLSPGRKFITAYLRDFKPRVVGISNLVAPTELETLKFANLVKRTFPEALVVVGGCNASARATVLVKNKDVDFVVVGEGEETMKELVREIERKKNFKKIKGLVFKNKLGKVMINPRRELIKNLDLLPFPAWHLLPMEEYFHGYTIGIYWKKMPSATVISSRGCPNACNFCTNEFIWESKWRARSVEDTMAEIRLLKKLYKVKEIQFVDCNIGVDRNRFERLCRALGRSGLSWFSIGGMTVSTIDPPLVSLMAKNGCFALLLGVEHGDPVMQKRIGKVIPLDKTKAVVAACKKVGIWTHGLFIVGLPGETEETAYRTLEYAIKADFDTASFFTALPLPGAKVYREVFKGRQVNMNQLRVYLSKARCSELTYAQVQKIIKNSFRQFLISRIKRELNPLQIIRRISQIRSLDDLGFHYRNFKRFIQIQTV